MELKDLDNREFEERADYIDFNDLINWTVETSFFEKIQRKAQRSNGAKQCNEHGAKSRKAASVHCGLGKLFWDGRHEDDSPSSG